MEKFRIAIIDDELDAIENIIILCKKFDNDLAVNVSTTNISESVDKIIKNGIDLLFLDTNIPRGSGIDLLERFPERKFDVVVISAYLKDPKILERFQIRKILEKPIDVDEFNETIINFISYRKENKGVKYQIY